MAEEKPAPKRKVAHVYDKRSRSVSTIEVTPEYEANVARTREWERGEAERARGESQARAARKHRRQQHVGRARKAVSAPNQVAKSVTSYSGEKMLAAELLAGFAIVAIRVVADYEVQDNGATRGKVFHPDGQLGPLPILCGLVITFFAFSIVAAGGGTRAKVAVILGGATVLTLGVKSTNEIKTVSGTIGRIGKIVVPGESGSEGSGASSGNTPGNTPVPADTTSPAAAPATSQLTGTQPAQGGIFPTPTGAAPSWYLPGSAGGSGNNAVANAQASATRALNAAVHAADSSATGKGAAFVENIGKSLVDEGTAAVDQITSTIKGWFGG